MNSTFFVAAVVTPIMVLITAGIVAFIGLRSNDRERRLARERGELPPG